MRTTIILFILFLTFSQVNAQDINPFESIGKEGKIITLSKGKYLEIENNDSLQRIGSVIVNTNTGQLYELLDTDTLYQESDLNPTIIRRWWSVDPLSAKYPSQSPYTFCNNNPILYKDADGRSGIITIIPGQNGNPGTIKLSFNIVMYGSGADPALAIAAQDALMRQINGQNLKYMLNGQEYTVQLDLKINYHSEASAFAEASGFFKDGEYRHQDPPNSDYSTNFVRVEDVNQEQKTKGDADPWVALSYGHQQGYISEWVGGLGGNSGFLISSTFSADYTELLHELWHGLFGQHTDIPSDITQVMLMFPNGCKAIDYPNIPKTSLTTNKEGVSVVNQKMRTLTVQDMNIIFRALGYKVNSTGNGAEEVPLESQGNTEFTLGSLNNNYYTKEGTLNNNANAIREE